MVVNLQYSGSGEILGLLVFAYFTRPLMKGVDYMDKSAIRKSLMRILLELSEVRDEIEINGDGYDSKLDKEAASIERKVEKFMKNFEES